MIFQLSSTLASRRPSWKKWHQRQGRFDVLVEIVVNQAGYRNQLVTGPSPILGLCTGVADRGARNNLRRCLKCKVDSTGPTHIGSQY